jgi:hypothetical protein
MAVFDTGAPIGTGQGVYMSAAAELVPDDETAAAMDVFSRRSLSHGGRAWSGADVRAGGDMRLYRARADRHWILAKDGRPDHRIPVPGI